MAATQSMIDFFQETGYLPPIDIYSNSEISAYHQQFAALVAREGRESSTFSLQNRHFQERFLWEMATHPKILDVVQELIGADMLLFNTRFMCKFPVKDAERFFAWHQDVAYFGIEPPDAVVCWIALDDSMIENGCLQIIPGSQKAGVVVHRASGRTGNFLRADQEIPDELIDLSTVVYLEQKAGSMSVHDAKTFHASNPNTSQRRRCGLIASFLSPKIEQRIEYVKQPMPEGYKWRPFRVVLVRGADRYGHFTHVDPPFPFVQAATALPESNR
jgi:ectoine hydroxylase-related dioxygenase (phytanoyl-CoA dioxygenase family)